MKIVIFLISSLFLYAHSDTILTKFTSSTEYTSGYSDENISSGLKYAEPDDENFEEELYNSSDEGSDTFDQEYETEDEQYENEYEGHYTPDDNPVTWDEDPDNYPLETPDTYENVDDEEVQSPTNYNYVPEGACAICRDGTYSFSRNRRGTCSHHGGVAEWLK